MHAISGAVDLPNVQLLGNSTDVTLGLTWKTFVILGARCGWEVACGGGWHAGLVGRAEAKCNAKKNRYTCSNRRIRGRD